MPKIIQKLMYTPDGGLANTYDKPDSDSDECYHSNYRPDLSEISKRTLIYYWVPALDMFNLFLNDYMTSSNILDSEKGIKIHSFTLDADLKWSSPDFIIHAIPTEYESRDCSYQAIKVTIQKP